MAPIYYHYNSFGGGGTFRGELGKFYTKYVTAGVRQPLSYPPITSPRVRESISR